MIRHMVAIDSKRGIAKDGVQPWKLSTDEKYFSTETKKYGGIVLMGRKTYEVIGRPLLGRENYVLTRDQNFSAEGVYVIHDLDQFLSEHEDVWVIGGGEIFSLTLARAGELYITHMDADFGCDTFYPEYENSFTLASQSEDLQENGLTFRFSTYRPTRT